MPSGGPMPSDGTGPFYPRHPSRTSASMSVSGSIAKRGAGTSDGRSLLIKNAKKIIRDRLVEDAIIEHMHSTILRGARLDPGRKLRIARRCNLDLLPARSAETSLKICLQRLFARKLPSW